MCKFNARLFVFIVVVSLLVLAISARPAPQRSLVDMLTFGNDYDLRYDQRQKGGENFRVKLDGFFIGVPAETTGLVLLTDELVNVLGEELLLGRHGADRGQSEDTKLSQALANAESAQKEADSYNRAVLEKAEAELLSPKTVFEGRDNLKQASRTKVYVMNLLDYIKRNRGT